MSITFVLGKSNCYLLFLVLAALVHSCTSNITSPNYFNQPPPTGDTPEIFSPSVVNTDSIELNVVFNSSFNEMFFSRIVNGSFVIYHSEYSDSNWTPIEPIQLYPDEVSISIACDPTISKDGNTMYFLGVDPKKYSNETPLDKLYRIPPDIYVSKKVNNKWQLATKAEYPISTEYFESYPVLVEDGSLYFQSNRPNGMGGGRYLKKCS